MGNHVESYKVLIGKKIQDRRVEMGFSSQAALAKKLGTEQPQVSRWETGENLPTGQLRIALSEALNVDDSFFELIKIKVNDEPTANITQQDLVDFRKMIEDHQKLITPEIKQFIANDKRYIEILENRVEELKSKISNLEASLSAASKPDPVAQRLQKVFGENYHTLIRANDIHVGRILGMIQTKLNSSPTVQMPSKLEKKHVPSHHPKEKARKRTL
jgi:transcriptional regulator with XRE-family HTH domain